MIAEKGEDVFSNPKPVSAIFSDLARKLNDDESFDPVLRAQTLELLAAAVFGERERA